MKKEKKPKTNTKEYRKEYMRKKSVKKKKELFSEYKLYIGFF